MAAQITELPDPPSRADDQQTFTIKADAFLGALPAFATEANALADDTETNADIATTGAATATTKASEAANSAAQALASANTAVNAPGTQATSTSSLTISTGSKILTLTQTGKAFVVNQFVILTNSTSNWMQGNITAFNSGTGSMTVDVVQVSGTGSFSSWTVTPSSPLAIPAPAGNTDKAVFSNGANFEYRTVLPPLSYIESAGTIGEGNHIFRNDVSVTLPDLTTSKFLALTYPNNFASTPTGTVTTADNWTISLPYSSGVTRTFSPLAFGSQHGWWGSLSMVPPVNGTSATIGSTALTLRGSVALSANCHVYVLSEAGATYAIACDPTTGQWGAPVTLSGTAAAGDVLSIFAVSSTSFFVASDAGTYCRAGSVSGLTITLGTSQALTADLADTAIQLTASTFLLVLSATTNNLIVASVSGTTVTLGTAVSSGTPVGANQRISPISSTLALVAYPAANAASSALTMRTVSISGTTITLNATTTSGAASIAGNTSPFLSLIALSASTFIACGVNSANTNDGSWYGVTVSGTTVTIGTVSVQAGLPWAHYVRSTYINRHTPGSARSWLRGYVLDSSRIIVAPRSTSDSVVAVSISGTALTFGTPFTTGTPRGILTDVSTGLNVYASGTTSYSKLSVSGVTITATYTVAVSPVVVYTDTLTDKTVNYGGTWYTWTGLPVVFFPISSSKYANQSSNVLRSYGSFN